MQIRQPRFKFLVAAALVLPGCMLFTDTSVNYVEPGPGTGDTGGGGNDTGGTTDSGGATDSGGGSDTGPQDTGGRPDTAPPVNCEAFCFAAEELNTCLGEPPISCGEALCRFVDASCRTCVQDVACGEHWQCFDACEDSYCELFPFDCEEQTDCEELEDCCTQIDDDFERESCFQSVEDGEFFGEESCRLILVDYRFRDLCD